jgi:hypothetical protein
MKIKKLTIHNIGKIADTVIPFDAPLLLFYGEIRAGKTTVLNAVRWCFGGAFPEDIIRHGESEAFVELEFEGGCIRREWYLSKVNKEVKARDLMFIRQGKPVASPAAEIKRLLNPFQINQDFLRAKSETERKQYFAEMFAVDTSALDSEEFSLDREATALRAKLKDYGEIDLTPPKWLVGVMNWRRSTPPGLSDWLTKNEVKKPVQPNPRPDVAQLEEAIRSQADTAALDLKLSDAKATAVRFEQYQKNLKREEQRKADEASLKSKTDRLREIKKERVGKLKNVSESCGIPDLEFDEAGNLIYQGTHAGMLSTSQIMHLSSALSAKYPEGFGIELVDRAESLGKSIFQYIDYAKEKERTVLAAIVGDSPSKAPAEVGVFVVEEGKVKKQQPELIP